MDLFKSMNVFTKVVDLGSFKKAAEVCCMTGTMVANHINGLESHLGGRLLTRTTRRITITPLGEAYYDRCQRILSEVADADELASRLQGDVRGQLRLSAPPSYGAYVFAPLVARFLESHPAISIDLVLTDRKVDLAHENFEGSFRIGALENEGLVARKLPDYRLMLAASPTYVSRAGMPKSPTDLKDHELIAFAHWGSDRVWHLIGPDREYRLEIKPRFLVNSGEAAKRAALAGFGIVLQSITMLSHEIESGELVPILPDYRAPLQQMHFVYLPTKYRSERLNRFISFCFSKK